MTSITIASGETQIVSSGMTVSDVILNGGSQIVLPGAARLIRNV